MKQIDLSQGKVALVDDSDYDRVSAYKWSYSGHGYAHRVISTGGKQQHIYMHRFILGSPNGEDVDHRNGDRLDNRRENLRWCSHRDNIRNHAKQKNNTSGYIGVSRTNGGWRAYCGSRGLVKHLGSYDTPEGAAIARDKEALKVFGTFAKLNFNRGVSNEI
jgi:hypothetical protein